MPQSRLILVGRTGTGKSATGNSISGQKCFSSRSGAVPVTRSCTLASRMWAGWQVEVVDTPDIFSSEIPRTDPGCVETARCFVSSAPGPHASSSVTQSGRFTMQDSQASAAVKRLFGKQVMARTVVVFTRQEDSAGDSSQDYVHCTDNRASRDSVAECGGRVCALNNRATGSEREAQAEQSSGMVACLVREHGGAHYSNEVYESVQDTRCADPQDQVAKVAEIVAERMQRRTRLLAGSWGWRKFYWKGWRRGFSVFSGVAILIYSSFYRKGFGDQNNR